MKRLMGVGLLGLLVATQVFSQVRTRRGERGEHVRTRPGTIYDDGVRRGRGERGVINVPVYLDRHVKGRNNVIALKREIKRVRPNMNLRRATLVGVQLMAKSKHGRGEAKLVVGNYEEYPQVVGGFPEDFHYNDPYTYDNIHMRNNLNTSEGRWQIHLRGNIKVRKVVVQVRMSNRRRGELRQVRLQMYGEHLRGRNTLKLKRLLRQQNPHMDIANMELKSVVLVAKSRQGRGSATLTVGQNDSYAQTIGGNPRDFDYYNQGSYYNVRLMNPSVDSNGRWQIQLRGNIKVQEVILKLRMRNNYNRRY